MTVRGKGDESDLINRLAIQEHEEREKNRYHNKKPKKTKRKGVGKGNVKLTHNEQVDKLVDDSMRIMRMRSDFD